VVDLGLDRADHGRLPGWVGLQERRDRHHEVGTGGGGVASHVDEQVGDSVEDAVVRRVDPLVEARFVQAYAQAIHKIGDLAPEVDHARVCRPEWADVHVGGKSDERRPSAAGRVLRPPLG
jgi:hypothetical protein